MFEKILVPLDGSKIGEAALPLVKELVTRLCPAQKVEVTLLQVVSSLVHYVVAGDASVQVPYTDHEVELIKKEAGSYLAEVSKQLKGLGATLSLRVAAGNPAEGIIKSAEETKADLIAMSTHGRSGLSRWAYGSVAEKVLQTSRIPILLVRAPRAAAGTESR